MYTILYYPPQGKVMFSQVSVHNRPQPCYSVVGTHPTGMLSCLLSCAPPLLKIQGVSVWHMSVQDQCQSGGEGPAVSLTESWVVTRTGKHGNSGKSAYPENALTHVNQLHTAVQTVPSPYFVMACNQKELTLNFNYFVFSYVFI